MSTTTTTPPITSETTPQALVEIFRRVLEVDDVTEESDFFEAGGDSLLATRVLSAIARDYDVELTFDDFVIAPNPDSLASLVESLRA
jgi:acyl carrier protein